MYSCTKFQVIWRTSDFGTKFAQQNMNKKFFEKINVKIALSIYLCIPIRNLSQFVELHNLESNLPKKI